MQTSIPRARQCRHKEQHSRSNVFASCTQTTRKTQHTFTFFGGGAGSSSDLQQTGQPTQDLAWMWKKQMRGIYSRGGGGTKKRT